MPWLRVKNLTLDWLVFDGVLGLVPENSTRTVFVRVAEVEALRTSLVILQEQKKIEFNVFNTLEIEDDDAEYVTLADIKKLISEAIIDAGAAATSGIFILRPGSPTIYPANIIFNNWSDLYTRLALNGGGIVIIDDSLQPGIPIEFPAGTYDLSGVYLEGYGSGQPTVLIKDGFILSNNSFRTRNLNLLFNNSSDFLTINGSADGLLQFIDSKVTMLSTGDLLHKVAGSTGSAEIILEGSIINSAASTGYSINIDGGEIVQLSATRCSRLFNNAVTGSGDIDAIRDLNSLLSKSHSTFTGTITISLCTGITRRYGIQLIGSKDSLNRIFSTPEQFIHDSLLGETIVIHHNGRKLKQSTTGSVVEGEYIPFESGGAGTGYDSIYFLAFTPNFLSNLEADYLPA